MAFDDPTIMFSVGEKVCELSGLSGVLSEMILDEEVAEEARVAAELAQKEADEKAYIIDGDALNPDILSGKLDQAAEDHYAAQ